MLIELFLPGVTAEALLANIDWKSAFLKGWISFGQIFTYRRGRPSPTILRGKIGQWIPYNFVADGFHTKILCRRLSSREVQFQNENGRFVFLNLAGGLGEPYIVHLKVTHWKARSRLPISDNWTFCKVLRLMRYERKSIENRRFRRNRASLAEKFQVEGVVPTNPFFLSEN